MIDVLYQKIAARVHALKCGIGRFLARFSGKQKMIVPRCYQYMRNHKMPKRYMTSDTKRWKIDLSKVDPHFAYRVDQATLGSQGAARLCNLIRDKRRKVFRWQFHAADAIASKRFKESPKRISCQQTSYSYEQIPCDFKRRPSFKEEDYTLNDLRKRENRLHEVERLQK